MSWDSSEQLWDARSDAHIPPNPNLYPILNTYTQLQFVYALNSPVSVSRCTRRTARQSAQLAAPSPHLETGPKVSFSAVYATGLDQGNISLSLPDSLNLFTQPEAPFKGLKVTWLSHDLKK